MDDYNPSGFLFPLARLPGYSTAEVEDAVEKLSLIYAKGDDAVLTTGRHDGKHVSGSLARLDTNLRTTWKEKETRQDAIVDSGYASAEEDEELGEPLDEKFGETLELVRNNSFEREFTIRWLTGFVARSSNWTCLIGRALSDEETEEREALVEKAASLLSSCANVSEDVDEAFLREFAFPLGTPNTGKSIYVELNDLVPSDDHNSVGLQSWASSIHFARLMCQNPAGFKIVPEQSQSILELGAGTGMLSISAAKIIRTLREDRFPTPTEIIATDYHPDVLANLQRNIKTNFPSDELPPVAVHSLDWQNPSLASPFDAPFDVILAADVIYEPYHARWIKNCVSRLLERPSSSCPEGGVFWMIIALRESGRHEGLADAVFDVFPTVGTAPSKLAGELSLMAVQVQDLERCDGVGRKDESGYRIFKICWV